MSLEERLAGLDLRQEDEEDVFDSVFQPMAQQAEEEEATADAAEEAASDCSLDDMTCAICLERTPLTDIALVKGCEHQYCVHCILQWAMCKEWCPQCKKPFDYLLCHRQLDGTLTDFLTEESVVLLKRARWFEDHMREQIAKGKAVLPTQFSSGNSTGYATAAAHDTDADEHHDWADYYEDYVDAELEEDEEIEQYYFSSAAGRARVVLGNRRWGEGGYMRAGRMYARPVQHTARTPNAAGGKTAKATDKGTAGTSPAANSSSRAGGAGSSSSAAAACNNRMGTGSSSSRPAGARSSSIATPAPASSSGRGRTAAAWLDNGDDDVYDYDYDDDFPCAMGSSAGSSSRRNNAAGGSSGSRSRSRPDRPAGMMKPVRQVPKNSPVCCIADVPVVTPLGKSPGSAGFHVGSWGAAGSSMGTPSTGSTPGSGRRAKRNARRAAIDIGGSAGGEWD